MIFVSFQLVGNLLCIINKVIIWWTGAAMYFAASLTEKLWSWSTPVILLGFKFEGCFSTIFKVTCCIVREPVLFLIILEHPVLLFIFLTLLMKKSFIISAILDALVFKPLFTSSWSGVPLVFQFINALVVLQVEAELSRSSLSACPSVPSWQHRTSSHVKKDSSSRNFLDSKFF